MKSSAKGVKRPRGVDGGDAGGGGAGAGAGAGGGGGSAAAPVGGTRGRVGPASVPARALLFGFNYRTPQSATLPPLSGCVNDVVHVAEMLQARIPGIKVDVVTDEGPTASLARCTRAGVLASLRDLVEAVNADPACEFVWIHYSGHGDQVRDRGREERDGLDEVIVTIDYKLGRGDTTGVTDDELQLIMASFARPTTRVNLVTDACHSGTMCDLKFLWEDRARASMDNPTSAIAAKVLLMSGCMDTQTSDDAVGSFRPGEAGGALTGCLLRTVARAGTGTLDAFTLLEGINTRLSKEGHTQRSLLSSSYNLAKRTSFFS